MYFLLLRFNDRFRRIYDSLMLRLRVVDQFSYSLFLGKKKNAPAWTSCNRLMHTVICFLYSPYLALLLLKLDYLTLARYLWHIPFR